MQIEFIDETELPEIDEIADGKPFNQQFVDKIFHENKAASKRPYFGEIIDSYFESKFGIVLVVNKELFLK